MDNRRLTPDQWKSFGWPVVGYQFFILDVVHQSLPTVSKARAARELAEQRLDAERKRFDVGMSTSFLVIQAQRDLAQARTSELAAILAYDLALVDFDAVQQASPEAS